MMEGWAKQEREAKREAKQRAWQEAKQQDELYGDLCPAKLRAERAEQERAERERRKRQAELDAQWQVGEAKWRYADAIVKMGTSQTRRGSTQSCGWHSSSKIDPIA